MYFVVSCGHPDPALQSRVEAITTDMSLTTQKEGHTSVPFPSSHKTEQVGKFYKRVWLYQKSKTTTHRDSLGSYRPRPRLAPSPQCTRFPAKPLEMKWDCVGVGWGGVLEQEESVPPQEGPQSIQSGLTGRDPPAQGPAGAQTAWEVARLLSEHGIPGRPLLPGVRMRPPLRSGVVPAPPRAGPTGRIQ